MDILKEGCTYKASTFVVTNEGIQQGEGFVVNFCKGNKQDESVFRQEGVFVEELLEIAKTHLEFVNKGELASRDTSMGITKIDEALLWIAKRNFDRQKRGVQGTYQK